MRISRQSVLFLLLIFVSIYASWQGIDADDAIAADHLFNDDVITQHAGAALQVNTLAKSVKTEPSGVLIGLPESSAPPDGYSPDSLASSLTSARIAADGSPVLVAVLDTGIDKNHEDLVGRVVAEITLSESPTTADLYSHGTAIAGIIAANADNDVGIAGIAPESLLVNVKVADDDGMCSMAALASGIILAVDYGARVINISIELKGSAFVLEDALDYAWEKGALVIAAAGNDGSSLPVYPAAYDSCLAVTAIQENGTLAPLANHGNWVDVAAPGMYVFTTLPGNQYGYKHGTSFATAYVSGLAAVLFSLATDTSGDGKLNDEVRLAIEDGCDALDIAGTGRGLINVAASVAAFGLGQ